MSKNQDIHGAILAIMESMRLQGTSPGRLKNFKNAYNVFEQYLSDGNISEIDESICLEYVHVKTGQRFKRFECVTSNGKIDYRMRPLLLLLRYLHDGQFHSDIRKTKPPFVCPACFTSEYEAFCEELVYRGYSKATKESNTQKVQLLIKFLVMQGVTALSDITIQHIEKYLKTIENKAVKYVGLFLYVFRNFFSFLYERGYIADNLVPMLPKVRTSRNASIPYIWSKTDLQKLLCAIDRDDPKGKRDYAILLLAIRLGLRISDIRNLKKSSIDWNRKTINLKMTKTGQPIELPLLKDIGWAIIDYLQNGRPVTSSECLFVRHRAPFNAFGDRSAFSKELHRYILKAGLNMPGNQWHGMHSLRSTLAGNMLEIKSPLPIISETLGHQSVNTTSIYLKIDIEGLRKCALDPAIVDFLNWIETTRNCTIATRNQRLVAIHSFVRFVQKQSPENLLEFQKILNVPDKKCAKTVVQFLTGEEMKILLSMPNPSTKKGLRDMVLMTVLYDSAARVQEIIDLKIKDLRLDKVSVITLHGKGQKTRRVPITEKTKNLLESHLRCSSINIGISSGEQFVFVNQKKQQLTRWGISYIIDKYVGLASLCDGFNVRFSVTPHLFRHSKSVHLLQSGVNLIYIRDFLGHSDCSTTQIYAKADTETRRKALEATYNDILPTSELPDWSNDKNLMDFLISLGR